MTLPEGWYALGGPTGAKHRLTRDERKLRRHYFLDGVALCRGDVGTVGPRVDNPPTADRCERCNTMARRRQERAGGPTDGRR